MDNKTTKPNPFDVMKKMANDGNPKIRLAKLSNIVAVDQKGKRCTITIGVGAEDVKNQMLGKTGYGGLFLIDTEEFERTEKEMMAELNVGEEFVKWAIQHIRIKEVYDQFEFANDATNFSTMRQSIVNKINKLCAGNGND